MILLQCSFTAESMENKVCNLNDFELTKKKTKSIELDVTISGNIQNQR